MFHVNSLTEGLGQPIVHAISHGIKTGMRRVDCDPVLQTPCDYSLLLFHGKMQVRQHQRDICILKIAYCAYDTFQDRVVTDFNGAKISG